MSATDAMMPARLETRELTRDEVHLYVKAFIAELQKKEFQEKLKVAAAREPVPQNEDELFDRIEEVQVEFFSMVPLTVPSRESAAAAGDSAGTSAPVLGETRVVHCDGSDVLAQLKVAAQKFSDRETNPLLTRMCAALEAQIYSMASTMPELKGIGQQVSTAAGTQGHGHSHGGQPCTHNHDHGHGHGHGHGHNAMARPAPQMENAMMMAMNSLSPDQKATLARAQSSMMRGVQPSMEDRQEMLAIQRHLMAFMKTMEAFAAPPQ